MEKKSICPHCKQDVDPTASRCPHCHGKIYRWTRGRKIAAVAIVVILVYGLVNTFNGSSSSSTTATQTSSQSSSLRAGNEALIHSPNNQDEVPVLPTRSALEQFVKASVAGDTYGMAEIMQTSGGYFEIPGTKVLILDTNAYGMTKFRIVEGANENKVGWLPDEFLLAK